ncbi:hypothetical protein CHINAEXTREME_06820 [Halobiforma lacisalsi AJ5]|uniref:UPF0215 protein C445_02726 n=1 Tax=Natronobacterium lacisalsi AJ5 TaxID=358396 RepID=M0LXQ6_NATLA|nr:DUF99 family protein [Halobiforma lacisalsi]APW97500.1 hypothetical protein CHINAEXTREME_06820 [Halobiforma lacisalsi AJ5]EMA37119.1 hypothetical protein C445_02726 [Halobiforma lacisalsi AJ5]
MKAGVRALGVAESYRDGATRSTLAAAVVRADRVVDGLAYDSCTVGGTDATDAVVSLLADLDRPDARYVLLGAVAPAWYNVLELSRIREAADRPVIAVTFEASDGLETGIRDAFSGEERRRRLERYRSLSPRRELSVNDETVYVRASGLEAERVDEVVRAFTPEGGRPEPIRVASLAARAADGYRQRSGEESSGGESE